MPGLLDILNAQDPNAAGLAALPAANGGLLNYTPPTTGNDSSVLAQDAAPSPLSNPQDLQAAVQTAAQTPEASKGLLGSFADAARNVADKLTSLSPAASQGLIATGLGILANNNGSLNTGQLIGYGGMSGLNAYNSTKQQEAQQAYLQQQAVAAQQKNALEAANTRLQMLKASAPIEVGGRTYAPNAAGTGYQDLGGVGKVARTQEVTNADGSKDVLQFDQNGNQVGQPISTGAATSAQPIQFAPEELAKRNADLQNQLTSSNQQIAQIDNLAGTIVGNQGALKSGWQSNINNYINNIKGKTDLSQQTRQQIQSYATQFINQSLPPGSASDADIRNARATVPDFNGDPKAILAWLATARQAQQRINDYSQAGIDWNTASRGAPTANINGQNVGYQDFLGSRGLAPATTQNAALSNQSQGDSSGGSSPFSRQQLIAEQQRRQRAQR